VGRPPHVADQASRITMGDFGIDDFEFSDPSVRLVRESDIEAIANLFKLNYGHDYPFPHVFDGTWVKRAIYSENIVCVVLQEEAEVIGTGAVLLDYGDYDDQLGELTRLAVHPDRVRHGAGRRIINALFEVVQDNVEFAFGEARTAHSFSQHMLDLASFTVIGFFPHEYAQPEKAEGSILYGRLHGHAQVLRSEDRPHLIPEVASLASHVLNSMRMPVDLIVVEDCAPYPVDFFPTLKRMDRDSAEDLERCQGYWMRESIEKGVQLEKPMLFGPVSIDQGLPFMKRHGATYMMAVNKTHEPIGAVGFLYDQTNQIMKGVELLGQDESVRGGLCLALVKAAVARGARIIETNVSAYDPRLQTTLMNLGFIPIAYGPAMVFHEWERLDIVKMIKLNVPYEPGEMKLTEKAREVVSIVEQGIKRP
jgi:N-acetylglutamate synthase-like GNAT family acetyltransferase